MSTTLPSTPSTSHLRRSTQSMSTLFASANGGSETGDLEVGKGGEVAPVEQEEEEISEKAADLGPIWVHWDGPE